MTSRHASDGGRRGIATWIIVTIVAVLVLAAATTAYLLIVGGDDEAAAPCTSEVVLPVLTAPIAADAITAAAAAFDATAPVARSACVSTTVTSLSDDKATTALAADGKLAEQSAPGMWVAGSEAALVGLEKTDSALTAGRDNDPIATSPVVIAVRDGDADAVTAAGLSWADLPNAAGPNGSVTLPSGRQLVLALPDPTTNRATSDALQSILIGASGVTVDPPAVSAAVVASTSAVLAAIGADSAKPAPATTEEALTQLAAGTAAFTAVPVVEADLIAFNATTPGLTGISPSGDAVGDAVYAVPLTASWIDPTLEDASALFQAYLRGPGGDTAFNDNGFRVEGESSTGGSVVMPVPAGGPAVDAALAAAIGAGPTG